MVTPIIAFAGLTVASLIKTVIAEYTANMGRQKLAQSFLVERVDSKLEKKYESLDIETLSNNFNSLLSQLELYEIAKKRRMLIDDGSDEYKNMFLLLMKSEEDKRRELDNLHKSI